jgi:hypothetical protein
MEHELAFTDVRALVGAFEMHAQVGGVQSCEIDLDQLHLTFTTRFPLEGTIRNALSCAPGLAGVRIWPSSAPVFQFAAAIAAAGEP